MPQIPGWSCTARIETVKSSKERREERRLERERVKVPRRSKQRKVEWDERKERKVGDAGEHGEHGERGGWSEPGSREKSEGTGKHDGPRNGVEEDQRERAEVGESLGVNGVNGKSEQKDATGTRSQQLYHLRKKILVYECKRCARSTRWPLPSPPPVQSHDKALEQGKTSKGKEGMQVIDANNERAKKRQELIAASSDCQNSQTWNLELNLYLRQAKPRPEQKLVSRARSQDYWCRVEQKSESAPVSEVVA